MSGLLNFLDEPAGEYIPHLRVLLSCTYLLLAKNGGTEEEQLENVAAMLKKLEHQISEPSFQTIHRECEELILDANCLVSVYVCV